MEPLELRGSSLASRVVVGVLFAPLMVWLLWIGGYALFAFLALLTLLAQAELFRMPHAHTPLPNRIISHLSGIAILADASFAGSGRIGEITIASLIGFFLIEIISRKEENRLWRILFSLLTTLYPAAFLAYLLKIALFPFPLFGSDNRMLLLFLVAAVWTYDTVSYFAGTCWGKQPFFVSISPRKTREGFIGGLLGTIALGAAACALPGYPFPHAVIVALLAGLAGQAGDLSESIIKRDMHIKDSSRMLLGHGGILDRFDSMFFAAPVVYGYLFLHSIAHGGCG